MLEHPLQRFFHSMRAKRPFDWVRFQRRDLLLIDHPLCQAVFSRQGAQLLHFQPQGERPLLWCASEWPALSSAPVRGGIPVCWPWFGSHPNGSEWPQQGWARQREWRLLDAYADESKVVVSWQLDLEDWHVRLDARLGQRLELELCSYHEEDDDCLFSFALQPYWRVGALSRVVVHGMGWSRLAASAALRGFREPGYRAARSSRCSTIPDRWCWRTAAGTAACGSTRTSAPAA